MNRWAAAHPEEAMRGISPAGSGDEHAEYCDCGEEGCPSYREFKLPSRPFGSVLAEIASVPGDGRGGRRSDS